jgi:hypothetical protein
MLGRWQENTSGLSGSHDLCAIRVHRKLCAVISYVATVAGPCGQPGALALGVRQMILVEEHSKGYHA